MEVNAEARRILAVSISKLYASRSQRGGLRLHRSLLLSLVMRSESDSDEEGCDNEITEDKENLSPARQSRKRRGKASVAPDFLPIKRARLESGEDRYAAPLSSCRAGESLAALSLNRVIPAF
uniref:Immediate early response 2b n=1 Tax=Monopterus albus TaxID=43700 RepID=A0A3Q3JLT1_MONAL